MAKKTAADEDRERILRTLRAILDSPGTGGRALAAKYAAAQRLARLTGISADLEADTTDPASVDYQAPDPMDDLTELESLRLRRERTGRLSRPDLKRERYLTERARRK